MPLRNLIIILLFAGASLVAYQRAARNRYAATLVEAMNLISTAYVDDVDQKKLFEGAMEGMVGQLDPYSGYTKAEDLQQLEENMDQKFVGIGVYVEMNSETKRLTIKSSLVGTPAYKAGLQEGDVILTIDGQDTAGLSIKESSQLIRGRPGSSVKLSIQRLGEKQPREFEIPRTNIYVDSVLGDLRDPAGKWVFHLADKPKLGYIRLTNFGEQTSRELQAALASYREPGQQVDGLIVDLRRNAGGLLTAAIEACDLFLDEGVIVSTRGRNNVQRGSFEAKPGVEFPPEIPLVVLVDKSSASASEIVAGCLQDQHRAVVAGQRSWGKGTVQNITKLEEGKYGALRVTIARYSRPSGKNIHKMVGAKDADDWGVLPDPGLGVDLTLEEQERVIKARQKRDILADSGKSAAAAGQKPEPPDAPATPPQPPAPRAAELDDPQLRKACEYLEIKLHPVRD